MAYPPQVKQALRSSFVFEFLPLEKAAGKHNVPYGTARSWKKKSALNGDDWDAARAATRLASGSLGDTTAQIVNQFVTMFQTTLNEFDGADSDPFKKAAAMASLSDAFAKFMKAAGGGDKKLAELSIAIKVLQELAAFTKENFAEDYEFMAKFLALLEAFGPRVNETFK